MKAAHTQKNLVGRELTLKGFHRETPLVAPDFCGTSPQNKQNTHATLPIFTVFLRADWRLS